MGIWNINISASPPKQSLAFFFAFFWHSVNTFFKAALFLINVLEVSLSSFAFKGKLKKKIIVFFIF